jgi:hypothetical protein
LGLIKVGAPGVKFSRRGGRMFTGVGILGQIVTFVGAGAVLHGEVFWRRSVTFVGAGAEWMRREDACVALGGGGKRAQQQDEGDASVPSPHNPTPAPTGTKGLPRRHEKKPPFVKGVPQALCPFGDMRKALQKGAIIAGQTWEVVN